MSSCLCSGRASICHQKEVPAPVLTAPHSRGQYPTQRHKTENHFQGPSSCIVPTNHPPTNKPLSRKQIPTTMQGAAQSFQLPGRTCCRQKSLLSRTFQVIWVCCVSKYSRTSPGYGKVDLKLHLPTPRGPFFKDVLPRPD